MKYFQRHWAEHPAWIENARQQMDQVYMEYSGTVAMEPISINTQSEMDDWCFGESIDMETELDEYLVAPVITLHGNEMIDSFKSSIIERQTIKVSQPWNAFHRISMLYLQCQQNQSVFQ